VEVNETPCETIDVEMEMMAHKGLKKTRKKTILGMAG
jgi:hypothetical protein